MRLISAYSKSPLMKRIFALVPAGVFLLVVLPRSVSRILEIWRIRFPVEEGLNVLVTLLGAAVTALVLRWVYLRRVSTEIEITEMGIQHLGPGRGKVLLWKDLIEARSITYGKGQRALRLKTRETRYLIQPHMVPDSPDAPVLRMGFPLMVWLYPDGHRERCDVEHSFGWKAVQKYRPDLLKS
jgi:hypothetical protein